MGRTDMDQSLFDVEQEALQSAMADIVDERNRCNELLPRYKLLVNHYRKLLAITRKIFRISDRQGRILQIHQNEIQNLLDNANQGFLTFGQDLRVNRQYSAECIRIFGRKIAGIPITQLLGQGEGIYIDTLAEELQRLFSSCKDEEQAELRHFPSVFRIGDKDVQVECKRLTQPEGDAESTLIMMILTDITEKLKVEKQIHYLSYHDKLTSLYNRAYIEKVLLDIEQPEILPLSIIIADMNGLKLVNDVFGHEEGDQFLIAMARALMKCCRQTDIIARWGGDEFLILLPRTDSNNCEKVCHRIRLACSKAVGSPIPLSAAIGSATSDGGTAVLAELFRVAENQMYSNKLIESREVRKSIITVMESMLQNGCFENAGHGERVYRLAADFASFLGLDLNGTEMKPLNQLAALHDIGKVAIPKEILGKTGPLTPSEWVIVKSHSDIGCRMAQSIGEPVLADIILALHERWDGKGYPYGLKENQIPLLARMFSLVDVYDIMTHDRPYEGAMNEKAVLKEIASGSGSRFDPDLTKQFLIYMVERHKK